jgi:hypothetical protein
VIGVRGNPLEDIKLMQNVSFVMKDGKIYKDGGIAVTPLAQLEVPHASIAQGEELLGY